MHDAKKKKKHPLQLVGALSNRGYILNAVRVVYICPLLPCVCLICSVFEKKTYLIFPRNFVLQTFELKKCSLKNNIKIFQHKIKKKTSMVKQIQ